MQYLLRKKITIVAFCMLAFSTMAFSQWGEVINLEEHDTKAFHFGIYLGTNRSHYSFSHDPTFLQSDSILDIESINSTGINLGWLVNMRLNEHFDLRAYPLNLVFTEKAFLYQLKYPNIPAGESTSMTKKLQGITLSFPFQLKFMSDRIYNFKVYMFAGGKLEYDFAANAGDKKAEDLIKLKKIDYGIEGGMGFHLYFPVFVLSPELKLGYGMRNIHARDSELKFSNVMDVINSRTITLSLTIE